MSSWGQRFTASFHYLLQGKHFVKVSYKREDSVASCFVMLNSSELMNFFDFFCSIFYFLFKQKFGNGCFSIYLTFGHLEQSRAFVTHIGCVKWSNAKSRGQIQLQSKRCGISKVTNQDWTGSFRWPFPVQVTEKFNLPFSALRELGVKMPGMLGVNCWTSKWKTVR